MPKHSLRNAISKCLSRGQISKGKAIYHCNSWVNGLLCGENQQIWIILHLKLENPIHCTFCLYRCFLHMVIWYQVFLSNTNNLQGSTWYIVTNMLDCKIVVSEFKLQSYCFIYFWTNSLGKGIEPLYPSQSWFK